MAANTTIDPTKKVQSRHLFTIDGDYYAWKLSENGNEFELMQKMPNQRRKDLRPEYARVAAFASAEHAELLLGAHPQFRVVLFELSRLMRRVALMEE